VAVLRRRPPSLDTVVEDSTRLGPPPRSEQPDAGHDGSPRQRRESAVIARPRHGRTPLADHDLVVADPPARQCGPCQQPRVRVRQPGPHGGRGGQQEWTGLLRPASDKERRAARDAREQPLLWVVRVREGDGPLAQLQCARDVPREQRRPDGLRQRQARRDGVRGGEQLGRFLQGPSGPRRVTDEVLDAAAGVEQLAALCT
jgi:hypothetical protein